MNNRILTFLFCGILAALVGCEKPQTSEGDNNKPGKGSLSGVALDVEISNITATTAMLAYSVDLGEAADMPIEVMLRYSVSDAFPTEATEVVRLKQNEPGILISGLQFDRQYHYEIYMSLYGAEYNAEKGSFTTTSVSVTLNEPSESLDGLIISGVVNGLSAAVTFAMKLFNAFAEGGFTGGMDFIMQSIKFYGYIIFNHL